VEDKQKIETIKRTTKTITISATYLVHLLSSALSFSDQLCLFLLALASCSKACSSTPAGPLVVGPPASPYVRMLASFVDHSSLSVLTPVAVVVVAGVVVAENSR